MSIMYNDLARWWPLLSPTEDYAEEAAFFRDLFKDHLRGRKPSLIEFGAGGGNNAFYLKSLFNKVLLTDLSAGMLEMSHLQNPDCDHAVGDMRTFEAGCDFDAVFIHDAIDYMTSIADLRRVFQNAWRHCKTGGAVMLVPDHTRETYEDSTDHGGSEGDGRSFRYLEWAYDPDPADTRTVVEYVFALREGNAPVRTEHETHHCGLFSRRQWRSNLRAAGFEVSSVIDPFEREVFLGRRL
jgi:ubiquinone/menaquinone biosynthesis C-methylase UbiE